LVAEDYYDVTVEGVQYYLSYILNDLRGRSHTVFWVFKHR